MNIDLNNQLSTRDKIVQLAQEAIAFRGYSAFSFRELATDLGIKSASIHYHFPTKTHLGVEVARTYRQRLAEALDNIAANVIDPRRSIEQLIAIYRQEAATSQRMTVCTMLAAEIKNLPSEIAAEMKAFYELNLHWLAERFAAMGYDEDQQQERACQVFALLQGALAGAKGQNSLVYFDLVVKGLANFMN